MIAAQDCTRAHRPPRPAFAPVVASREFADVDAMAAAIVDDLSMEFLQLEASAFHGRWSAVRYASIVVQYLREDVANVHRLSVPPGRWVFVLPLAVPGGARWDGVAIDEKALIVCPPGSESFAFDQGQASVAMLSISAPASPSLTKRARALIGLSQASQVFFPNECAIGDLWRQLADLGAALDRDVTEVPRLCGASADALRAGLLAVLEGLDAGAFLRERYATKGRVVRRAERFIRAHVGEALSIAQLSTVAGVSERSLRNAFQDVCTTSPKRYLKIWQLHQVRRALRASNRESVTVTDAATLYGFFELGRFAGEYKALFGEVPSQTLQRAREQSIAAAS